MSNLDTIVAQLSKEEDTNILLLPNKSVKLSYIIKPQEELEITIIEENTLPFEIAINDYSSNSLNSSTNDIARIALSLTRNYAKYKVEKKEIIIKNINKKPIKLEIKEIRRKIK